VKWGPVLAAAQEHGLAPLLGSTTDVGVVGYSFGGGMGWLARKYGLAVDTVRAFDIVTADGRLRHVDAQSDPELFWGARGGAGNFGIVTRVELDLYPITEVYAGNLIFPLEMAREVLVAYREWIAGLSDDWTTGVAMMHMPPAPFVPEPLRGKSVLFVRGAYAGEHAQAEADLRPMRDLGGLIIDAFGPLPFRAADAISNDPLEPMSVIGRTETLADLSDATIETLLRIVGRPDTSPIMMAEVRQLGGAVARDPERPSAFSQRDMPFVLLMGAPAFDPSREEATQQYMRAATEALQPHRTGQIYLNFLHDSDTTAARVRAGFTAGAYDRLVALKDQLDPANMFRFNRNIPPSA
jgi:FAD/FMN-containing dehydrogenase